MSMMIEYYAVVVLYNKRVQDSITISCLMKLKEEHLHIMVLDNSADDYVEKNKTYFLDSLVTYHSMGGNVGLSKAYNYALSILKNIARHLIVKIMILYFEQYRMDIKSGIFQRLN